MLSSNSNTQNINSNDFILDEISSQNPNKLLSAYLSQIKAEDIEQIKIYLGVVYFVVFSVISVTLFF